MIRELNDGGGKRITHSGAGGSTRARGPVMAVTAENVYFICGRFIPGNTVQAQKKAIHVNVEKSMLDQTEGK